MTGMGTVVSMSMMGIQSMCLGERERKGLPKFTDCEFLQKLELTYV
jgi:hypothetical protein